MAQVVISINDREYPIACENGQETRILQLAQVLQQKAEMLQGFKDKISENMMLAMIGILVADDLFESRKNASAPVVAENTPKTEYVEKIRTLENRIKSIAKIINSL